MGKILVCGEMLVDIFAGKLVNTGQLPLHAQVGGSCANVAIGVSRLGELSSFLTALPDNAIGRQLLEYLQQQDVDTSFIAFKPQALPLAFVSVDDKGHPDYTFYADNTCEQNLISSDLPPGNTVFHIIHVASYPLTKQPTADTMYEFVQQEKGSVLISYDPNVRLSLQTDKSIWQTQIQKFAQVADVIKVSSEDLFHVYETHEYERIVSDWQQGGAALVIVTDGENGATAFHNGAKYKQPSYTVKVVDTVGAGDSFQGALLYQLNALNCLTASDIQQLSAAQITYILKFASAASAITCTRKGPDLPTHQEVIQFL